MLSGKGSVPEVVQVVDILNNNNRCSMKRTPFLFPFPFPSLPFPHPPPPLFSYP